MWYTRARPPLRASSAWRLLGGESVCATAVTRRALVYSMDVPLALMRTPNVVNAYIRIAVAGGAFDARDRCLKLAGTHVGAHEITRTPNFGGRAHGSYVQLAIILFFPKNN